jgi:hypothetical protein
LGGGLKKQKLESPNWQENGSENVIFFTQICAPKNAAGVNGGLSEGSTMCNPGARTTIAPSGNLLILLFIHHFVLLIIKETSCVSDHKRKVYNSQQPQEKLC